MRRNIHHRRQKVVQGGPSCVTTSSKPMTVVLFGAFSPILAYRDRNLGKRRLAARGLLVVEGGREDEASPGVPNAEVAAVIVARRRASPLSRSLKK